MIEIGRCVGIEHMLGLWWLRMDLRELAYDTWVDLKNEGWVQKSTRRDLIEDGVENPADQLVRSLSEIQRIGALEALALAETADYSVDLHQLRSDIGKLRDWARAAKKKAMDGSVPKGITVVRQNFVDRLLYLYSTIARKDPTRNVAKGDRHYEVSKFTTFVNLCAAPIFDQTYDFTPQIREAKRFNEAWLRAGATGEMPEHITEEKLEKIRLKIEGENP